jgi:hypothetical protein
MGSVGKTTSLMVIHEPSASPLTWISTTRRHDSRSLPSWWCRPPSCSIVSTNGLREGTCRGGWGEIGHEDQRRSDAHGRMSSINPGSEGLHGHSRTGYPLRSGDMKARMAQIPKLIVRVRFSLLAPRVTQPDGPGLFPAPGDRSSVSVAGVVIDEDGRVLVIQWGDVTCSLMLCLAGTSDLRQVARCRCERCDRLFRRSG